MRAAGLIAFLLLAGCASPPEIRYRAVPPELIPDPPVVPTIPASDLQCLSEATYSKLATRDKLRRQYAKELRALLETGAEK